MAARRAREPARAGRLERAGVEHDVARAGAAGAPVRERARDRRRRVGIVELRDVVEDLRAARAPVAVAQAVEELRAARLVAAALAEDLPDDRVGGVDVDARPRPRAAVGARAARSCPPGRRRCRGAPPARRARRAQRRVAVALDHPVDLRRRRVLAQVDHEPEGVDVRRVDRRQPRRVARLREQQSAVLRERSSPSPTSRRRATGP